MTPPGRQVHVLGGFRMLMGGRGVAAPTTAAKVIALLAVNGRPMYRSQIAGTMWPTLTEQRATANLRSIVCRLPAAAQTFVDATGATMSLADGVEVDLTVAGDIVRRILDLHQPLGPGDSLDGIVRPPQVGLLCSSLLPEWEDDWLVFERERIRQLHIHALERLAEWLIAASDPFSAVDVGVAAIGAEPLRESAHILVIRAHLAAGNRLDARRCFDRYCEVLRRELNVEPAVSWTELASVAIPTGHEERTSGSR